MGATDGTDGAVTPAGEPAAVSQPVRLEAPAPAAGDEEKRSRIKASRVAERARIKKLKAEKVRVQPVASQAIKNNVARAVYEKGGLRAVNRMESRGFGGVSLAPMLQGIAFQQRKESMAPKIGAGMTLPNISAKEGRSILQHIGAGFDYSKAMGDFSRRVLEAVKDDQITEKEAEELNAAAQKVVVAAAALAAVKRGG